MVGDLHDASVGELHARTEQGRTYWVSVLVCVAVSGSVRVSVALVDVSDVVEPEPGKMGLKIEDLPSLSVAVAPITTVRVERTMHCQL